MPAIAGHLTDRSGTITTGGTAQTIAAAVPDRIYLVIQNVSAGDLWVNFGVAAVANQPSLKLATGNALEFSQVLGVVPDSYISIIGATTGQAFTAKEA